jgi:hypothetical protein
VATVSANWDKTIETPIVLATHVPLLTSFFQATEGHEEAAPRNRIASTTARCSTASRSTGCTWSRRATSTSTKCCAGAAVFPDC